MRLAAEGARAVGAYSYAAWAEGFSEAFAAASAVGKAC
jgi:hypothetical protein